jgi:hypothetical protein
MRRLLLLVLTAVLPACYGVYSVPFTSLKFGPEAPKKSSQPKERIRISAESRILAVGDTFELKAELMEPDTLLPAFLWTSRSRNLSLSQEGAAVFKARGEGEACVQVWYFYLPHESGGRNMLRTSTNKPTCTKLLGK